MYSMKTVAVFILAVVLFGYAPAFARDGLLGSSCEQVVAILGQPSRHENGKVAETAYDRYYFETRGWKTAILFIDGRAQKLETEKSDGSALTPEEQKSILDGYDLPNTDANAEVRGWRELNENHFIRRDGRVHVIKHPTSMIVFLDDLVREFW